MKTTIWLITFGAFITIGCASTEIIIPSLERRTLDISRDFPGFVYRYQECKKKFLGMCTKWEQKVDTYDLTDPVVRNRFADMGFVAKVREKIGP